MDKETLLVSSELFEDPATGAVNPPIYLTSTFRQKKLRGEVKWEYARTGNPTRAALENAIAALEGGDAGFAFASGLAALDTILSTFESGDKILISENVYGGTFRLLDRIFSRFNLKYGIADTTDQDALNDAFTEDVKAVLIESPSNPCLTVTDIAMVADAAHAHDAILIVDNTFMTPYLQNPIALGADIVVHSATKYLGGHSDLVAGLAVTKTKELSEKLAYYQNAGGGVLDPFDAFLIMRGIKTLAVRMDRHQENAEKIANWLNHDPRIKRVYYPGFEDAQGYEIQIRQARGAGGMISFELNGGDIAKFVESLKVITFGESLGGVESLLCHPASMTHASIPKELREKLGITEELIRLSAGIESAQDLINDLDQAISASIS